MSTITQRELSNQTSKVLDELEKSGRVIVTRNGRPAALLLPIGGDALDALLDHVLATAPEYVQPMADVQSKIDAGKKLDSIGLDEMEAELGITDL